MTRGKSFKSARAFYLQKILSFMISIEIGLRAEKLAAALA